MSSGGVDKSAISRIKGMSWNTVQRWLQQASLYARHFNAFALRGYRVSGPEYSADSYYGRRSTDTDVVELDPLPHLDSARAASSDSSLSLSLPSPRRPRYGIITGFRPNSRRMSCAPLSLARRR